MIKIAKLAGLTKDEFLEIRRQGIGASEVAGIMESSPWSTPLSVYVEKVEGISDREESLQMELGIELEPFMRRKFAQWLKKGEGIDIEFEEQYMYAHDDYSFLRCTPDDMFVHPEHGLVGAEYKTASEFAKSYWSEDEVPDQYYIQVQACMAVTGCQKWYLAYLIGNRKFEVVLIDRHDDICEEIIGVCHYFWTEHVEKKIPPAPTGLELDFGALKLIYPEGQGEVELLDLEVAYDKLQGFVEERKGVEDQINLCKQQIMSGMKDNEVAILGYKENGRPKKAVWKMTEDAPIKAYIRKGSRQFRTF